MSTFPVISSSVALPAQLAEFRAESGMNPGRAQGAPPTVAHEPGVEISISSRLQSGREVAIALGARARAADTTFDRSLRLVEDMKSQLTSITKQFPPFAADSSERFQFLNNFSGLRAQIESLTFPPEPKASGEWSGVDFPPERMDWDVPFLDPANATDEQVQQAEVALERLGQSLMHRRQSFHESMAAVIGENGADHARSLSLELRHRLAA
jgi:hypothetical protein